MSLPAGTHKLGPEHGALSVRTGRRGAVARAGHDLLIEVTAWEATLELGDDPERSRIALDADAGSLVVREGTGGMQALGADDMASIRQTIDDEVLHGQPIRFRSSVVRADGDRITVHGQLTLVDDTHPLSFELVTGDDGELRGVARVKQTDWGIKPYTALFGALKVADEVEIAFQAKLDQSR